MSGESGRLALAYIEALELCAITVVADPARRCRIGFTSNFQIMNRDGAPFALWSARRHSVQFLVVDVRQSLKDRETIRGVGVLNVQDAIATIRTAAARLNIDLEETDQIRANAATAVAIVEEEIAKLQKNGGMKSLNQTYKAHRLALKATGKAAVPYGAWMHRQKVSMVRAIAQAASQTIGARFGDLASA